MVIGLISSSCIWRKIWLGRYRPVSRDISLHSYGLRISYKIKKYRFRSQLCIVKNAELTPQNPWCIHRSYCTALSLFTFAFSTFSFLPAFVVSLFLLYRSHFFSMDYFSYSFTLLRISLSLCFFSISFWLYQCSSLYFVLCLFVYAAFFKKKKNSFSAWV